MPSPGGVVALLFTDLVRSTELLTSLGDDAADELAECATLAGDEETAGQAANLVARVTEATGCDVHRGMQALASAWAALTGGGSDTAGLARQAITVLDGLEFPLLQGRAYDLLGRTLIEKDPHEAAGAFREAVTRFESCGATWRRDRALAELDRLGR